MPDTNVQPVPPAPPKTPADRADAWRAGNAAFAEHARRRAINAVRIFAAGGDNPPLSLDDLADAIGAYQHAASLVQRERDRHLGA